jgi:hypothetical protein
MLTTAFALLLAISTHADSGDRVRPAVCTFVAVESASDPTPQLEPRGICGHIEEGQLRLSTAAAAALGRDSSGLGAVFVDDEGWYYVAADGSSARVLTLDNGPDDFSEGLVRTWRDGKVAFLDSSLVLAIPPRYDFAWPFEAGRALVCSGCTIGEPDAAGHSAVRGGLWGYIDKSGKEVVSVTHTRDELYQRHPDRH